MGKNGNVEIRDLENFRKNVEKHLGADQIDQFIESCAKELAARLLAKVIKRTPVGQYEDGKKGGTLRRGWTTEVTGDSANDTMQAMYENIFGGSQHVSKKNMTVHKFGDCYVIEIVNPVQYASYVEFGHRTRNHKGWVEGKFMLTISEEEIRRDAPRVLENKLKKKLGECFK